MFLTYPSERFPSRWSRYMLHAKHSLSLSLSLLKHIYLYIPTEVGVNVLLSLVFFMPEFTVAPSSSMFWLFGGITFGLVLSMQAMSDQSFTSNTLVVLWISKEQFGKYTLMAYKNHLSISWTENTVLGLDSRFSHDKELTGALYFRSSSTVYKHP